VEHSDLSVNPGSDPEAQRGQRALDLLGRDLDGGLTEVIAGRYVVGERLGHGAHGDVHRARDRLTGETVAIKLLPSLIGTDLVSLRSEIAALRLLQLPGVAHLYDEGSHHGRPFLVMELVEGEPFPGRLPDGVARWSWELLRGPTLALLDTLARVHAAGLVHRDLKPRNVLVTAAGRPVVLDFGLTVGRALADDSASDSRGVGTPAYAAPEQCRGETVDARADLYALGVMLWEALAGRRPHPADHVSGIIRSRLAVVAEPVARYAPDVPGEVADLVDQLLEIERERRPRSAVDVGERLRGEARADAAWQPLLVGRHAELQRLIEAATAGKRMRVVGPPGSGRTRLLQEAAQCLEAAGRRVLWAQPGSRPFESLAVLSGWIPVEEPASLQHALDATAAGLRLGLAAGAVLVVDDLESLDEWSRRVVEVEAATAPVLESAEESGASDRGEELRLAALGEDALRGLFAGDDRLQHVHEDAARELWERTAGLAASVTAELLAWLRAGLAEPAGARVQLTRAAIDRLRGGLHVLPVTPDAPGARSPLDDDVDELLAFVHLAWPNTDLALLTRVSGRTAWLLEAELDKLSRAGAVRLLPDGRARPLRTSRRLADATWLGAARRSAHAELAAALAPGATGRLYHLVAAGDDDAAALEACAIARAQLHLGRLNDAEAALGDGLRAARRLEGPAARSREREILNEWLPVALGDVTPVAVDRLLYETSRSSHRDAELLHFERLLRAGVGAYAMDGGRALAAVDAVAPFADEGVERWRQALRTGAARHCPVDVQERVLDDARTWGAGCREADVAAAVDGWEGWLRYRQGRYREAALLHQRCAERQPSPVHRLPALLNAASALLEAQDFDGCASIAREAGSLAASCRNALYEGRAAWLLRMAAYRRGERLVPDLGLVEALERVGMQVQAAIAALTEAAVAWRQGDRALVRDLTDRAIRSYVGSGWRDALLLCRCLRAAAGSRPPSAEEGRALLAQGADLAMPEIAAQAVALLVSAGMPPPANAREMLEAARRALAGRDPAIRLDVLSLDELAVLLEGRGPLSVG
jgi:eukaryotic-like serine/threonine-protein kinase